MKLEINTCDRQFYETCLRDFLPDRMIDIHTHLWLKEHNIVRSSDSRTQSWPMQIANENSIEDLRETYRLMFPDKEVSALVFAMPECDIDSNNQYVVQAIKNTDMSALLLTHPKWSAEQFEIAIKNSGCLGAKVYLNLADAKIPRQDICIFDFLPHHHLNVLDRHGWIVMLHIPRDLRLRDPLNIEQLLEIEQTYKNLKLIIAHIGRAYCDEDLGNAFEQLSVTQNMLFDFSANTNRWIFEQTIQAFGPNRILFGSDLPITRMRMKRITRNGTYVNIVPEGIYRNIENDLHMQEVSGRQADSLTFFLYEQIDAFRRASANTGLTKKDIGKIFYDNAYNLIHSVKDKTQ